MSLPNVAHHSRLELFSDDAKMYTKLVKEENFLNLRKDLKSVYHWSVKWGMTFNESKCNGLNVTSTRFKNPVLFNYNVNGDVLEIVNDIRDIGIIFDKTLSWNSHVNDIVTKSNKILGLIKWTHGYSASQKVKWHLYNSLVYAVN